MNIRHRIFTAALLAAGFTGLVQAQAPVPGDKWKVQTSMQMGGMSMPMGTNQVCVPRSRRDNTPPMEIPKNCTVSNLKASARRMTFDMVCTGKDAMSGTMDMIYDTPDHYISKMTTMMEGQQATMQFEGNKQPGDCDAAEMERLANKMRVRGEQAMAQGCSDSARALSAPGMFFGPSAQCKDPKDIKTFCSNYQTYQGYNQLAGTERAQKQQVKMNPGLAQAGMSMPLSETAKGCGVPAEAVRKKLCGSALADDKLGFVTGWCPDEKKKLAQTQCSGRGFSGAFGFGVQCRSGRNLDPANGSGAGRPATPGPSSPGRAGCGAFDRGSDQGTGRKAHRAGILSAPTQEPDST